MVVTCLSKKAGNDTGVVSSPPVFIVLDSLAAPNQSAHFLGQCTSLVYPHDFSGFRLRMVLRHHARRAKRICIGMHMAEA